MSKVLPLLRQRLWGLAHLLAACLAASTALSRDLQWAPLEHHLMVFAEVEAGGSIFTDVGVTFYTKSAENKKFDAALWTQMEADRQSNKLDPSLLPMSDRLGFVLLTDVDADEILMVIIEENSTVLVFKADEKHSTPAIYQPLYANQKDAWCFRSKRVADALLALPGVALSEDQRYPWKKALREAREKAKK